METDKEEKETQSSKPVEIILRIQSKRKKNGVLSNNLSEVDKFTDIFNKKQKEIENELETLKTIDPAELPNHINSINTEIQELQKLYSNATLYLRIYDRKIFQESLQGLQTKLQNLENQLMPKKKFGFKVKKNNVERGDLKSVESEVDGMLQKSDLSLNKFVGISGKSNEELTLDRETINKCDIVLKDLQNCSVRLEGVPSTVHATNIDRCKLYFGPVVTSVFLENVRGSDVHLACQQLRIHDTNDTDFRVHVTSKSVIENCKNVRFGPYDLHYNGINEDFDTSGLNKEINNWDQVDDFNWLISSKPSPNWSKLAEN